ncbi:cadherin-like beta sandwich domain-containing protein [Candidatus Poriferisocius sp.]|uniref:cadherin-like beta sandwich domain-containing protein n=1 Tax=Candidatus Poriferisocius sp. TaxID=3101276 RepID=UPI003B011D74
MAVVCMGAAGVLGSTAPDVGAADKGQVSGDGWAADFGDISDVSKTVVDSVIDDADGSVERYRFELSSPQSVEVVLRLLNANADVFLEDADGEVLGSGVELGKSDERFSLTLAAGTYGVKVESAGPVRYRLKLKVTEPVGEPVGKSTSESPSDPETGTDPQADADPGTGTDFGDVWTAVLDVGVNDDAVGYSRWAQTGSLTPVLFDVDGSSYDVILLAEIAGGLYLGLRRSLDTEFTLDIDGQRFVGSQSLVPAGLALRGTYWWPTDGVLSGSVGSVVDVSLSAGSDTLPERGAAPPGAWFSDVPDTHDGSTSFTLELNFDEADVEVTAGSMADALTVTGGSLGVVTEVSPAGKTWELTVTPDTAGDVTVSLSAPTDCVTAHAVCTADGRMLRNTAQAVVRGTADDDTPPVASVADASVAEDVASGQAQVTVTLSQASGKDISVGYSARSGGKSVDWHPVPDGVDPAWDHSDFTKPAPGSRVAIPAGDTTATIAVAITDDDIDEINESFTVELFSPTNATVDPGASSAEVIIVDDDAAPEVSVTAGAAVTEGAKATFTLTMSRESSLDVTVQVSTSAPDAGHEATAGDDYTPLVDHAVVIPQYQTTETFTVSTLDDSIDEQAEAFKVAIEIPLSHPDRYPDYYRATVSATAGSATGTIDDDDPPAGNADLSSLTVDGVSVAGFSAGTSEYQFGVDASVAQVTVLGVADGAAAVAYSGTDADRLTDGHQVGLREGRNVVTVTVTAADGVTTKVYTVGINRGSEDPFGWSAGDDFDTLAAAENGTVTGLWSDGTTMWVADDTDGHETVFAYTLATKQRDPSKDIDVRLSSGDSHVRDIWSDGTTMWVANQFEAKLFAYTLAGGQRDPAKDIDTDSAAGNDNPLGLWSDGTTIWVSDGHDTKLFAYTLATQQRDPGKDIDTDPDRGPSGLWSDGTTMWVADQWASKIFAYTLATEQRDPDRDFDTLSGYGHRRPWSIWSDGTTMWVSGFLNDKLFAYNMPGNADPGNADLSALTVDGVSVAGFSAGTTEYQFGVDASVAQVTVLGVADGAAAVAYSGTDADRLTDGHQVGLSEGRNVVTVTVTAADNTTKEYTVGINRGSEDPFGWSAGEDFDTLAAAGNKSADGLWSDGTTMWVSDDSWGNETIFAYTLATKQRDPSKDIHVRQTGAFGDAHVRDIWSDGTTMWVANHFEAKLFAYTLADGQRNPAKDLDTDGAAGNDSPLGLWSDGTTLWVSDTFSKKIFAYTLADGQRDPGKDIDTDGTASTGPVGLWSDGTTMWVADSFDAKLYAYTLADGQRDPDRDFDTLSGHGHTLPWAIWSDGATMWVSGFLNDKIFAYNMPGDADPGNAELSALTVDGVSVAGFSARDTAYQFGVGASVARVTVLGVADGAAAVVYSGTDADGLTDGHQVDLSEGRNNVRMTVTAADGRTRKGYTVSINRGSEAPYGWSAEDDFDTLAAADNRTVTGLWSDGTTMWVADDADGSERAFAYTLATKQRDPGKDIDLRKPSRDTHVRSIWSDGTTMWMGESFDNKLYAFTLADGQRDPGKDIDIGNQYPYGLWSDGTTMWVSDIHKQKIFAYTLADGQRDPGKDFDTLDPANARPAGLWSDGTTMWVANTWYDEKIFAYTLATKQRDPDRDFDTLFWDGQDLPRAIWSDGTTMWVASNFSDKLFAYNMPGNADLSALSLSAGTLTPAFGSGIRSYTVPVANSVSQVTVTAQEADAGNATVVFLDGNDVEIPDADDHADGQQVDLALGDNTIKVKVTASDLVTTRVYTLTVHRAVPSWEVSVGSESIAEEGETSTTVTVSTGGVTFTEAKTVTLVLAGTATEVDDYTVTAKTLTLAAGEVSANATVTAVDDAVEDSDESIEITAMLDGAVIGVPQTITIEDNDGANTAPVFSPQSVTRQVAENAAPGTPVGSPVTATDADLHTLTYTLGGADAASFTIVAASGQIQTITGVVYDHEAASNTFSVTVTADDDNGGTATAAVVIDLADEDEPPPAPAALAVTAAPGSSTSLDVSWTAPDTTQRPDITGYGVQYRKTGDPNWTAWTPPTLATATSISGLAVRTEYEVQVNATNDEGTSGWSTSGTGSTDSQCSQDFDPEPTPVEVTAVPIVVASNTDEYFVLYVSHTEGGTVVETPVAVIRGEASTTTLAENVPALPPDRYRVEKYLIADPADVDGDCIDDLTELDDLGTMSPVNPAPAIDLVNGAAAVPDQPTFETLAYGGQYVKFVLLGMDTESPTLFFINSKTHLRHPIALFLDAIGHLEPDLPWAVPGEIVYDPALLASDGSTGVYYWWLNRYDNRYSTVLLERIHTLLAAGMPLLDDDLALHIPNHRLASYQSELPLLRQSRIPLMFDEDIHPGSSFLPMNPAVGYGQLRVIEQGERPNPRDIAIYEALPNELPRVAGIITTVPQTPLSHVNLRATQDAVPNAFIQDALDDTTIDGATIDDLLDSYVRYEVTESGWSLRAASPTEVDAHYAALRPATAQVPQRDLSVTAITPLSSIGFEDWDAFGVKAANVAVLGTLGFPPGTVPEGFAVPFYFYDAFMTHNGFYDDIEEMLADEEFQTDFDVQEDMLKDLRKAIKKGQTPAWILEALTAMHATYPVGQSLRYRSSTNNEDLPGFSGAGLYDSKTQDPDETTEDGIDKSLKGVYASLWNFRAFAEREFHRIDHLATAMGVLVHPNYTDELANGVAASFDPIRGYDGFYYLNTQLGEDLVTNPDAYSEPEEILLHPSGNQIEILATSNQVEPGELLLTDAQLRQLGGHLEVIHDHFKALYDPAPGEPFAMEIEFKITSSNILAIKQARPWVFSLTNQTATGQPTITGTPQVDETLSADTSGISDANGLTNVQFNYQWIRSDGSSDTNIVGATGQTRTLTQDDLGKTIKVQVSFTDDQGFSETLTSAATAAVSANPLETLWSGEMTVADYGSSSLGAYNDDTLFSNVTSSIQLQVKWLWYLETERKLYLAFRAPVSGTGDWTLHIDDVALDFPSGNSNFVFRNVDVSWTAGQVVNVRIVR